MNSSKCNLLEVVQVQSSKDARAHSDWNVLASYINPMTNILKQYGVNTILWCMTSYYLVTIYYIFFFFLPFVRLAITHTNLANVRNQFSLWTWPACLLEKGQFTSHLVVCTHAHILFRWELRVTGERARSSRGRGRKTSFCWLSCLNTWHYSICLESSLFHFLLYIALASKRPKTINGK